MGRKRKDSFNEAIVGIFMTAVILLLAYFTIVISGVDVLRGDTQVEMRVVFDQVGGLKDHDNVMYRGTKVGKIESVEVTTSNLVVTASVNRNVILREGYEISVCNLSMLGGNYLLLEEGEGVAMPVETTIFRGKTPTDWMRDVTEIAENVRRFTEMKELNTIVSNVASVSAKADLFMDKANRFGERCDKFMDNVDGLTQDAHDFMVKANDAADRVQDAIVEARGFIENATKAANTIETAANTADEILHKMNRDKMFDDLEAGIAAFRTAAENFDVQELVKRADELTGNLNDLALSLKNGEGTLGKLVKDESMYNEINGLIRDARQILDNYRDTTPISTFSSLATGAL